MGNTQEITTLISTYNSAHDLMRLVAVASVLMIVYLVVCLFLDIRKKRRLEDLGDTLDAIHEVWEEEHGVDLIQ